MTTLELMVLIVVATLGHILAGFWYLAKLKHWKITERTIFDLPVNSKQLRRELLNSLHTPMHAVLLAIVLYLGFFENKSLGSFIIFGVATTIWAEVWHYFSHRAFHWKPLHWIHVEHHRSHLNTPLTALSFSLWEKLVFNAGMILPFMLVDQQYSVNFYGVAAWYIGYLIINSFSHANFEIRSETFPKGMGRIITTTTYHSLHHARYTGNYGLATRVLDRVFGTEWADYSDLYDRVNVQRNPLTGLKQKVKNG